MPVGGDTNLYNQKVVLESIMIEGLEIDFDHIIIDEIFVHSHKTKIALPFSFLVTELCR